MVMERGAIRETAGSTTAHDQALEEPAEDLQPDYTSAKMLR